MLVDGQLPLYEQPNLLVPILRADLDMIQYGKDGHTAGLHGGISDPYSSIMLLGIDSKEALFTL